MPREASWSRSNFSWGPFRCRRPNVTLAASSGFDQPLMIVLASSRLLELDARLWKACRLLALNDRFQRIMKAVHETHEWGPSLYSSAYVASRFSFADQWSASAGLSIAKIATAPLHSARAKACSPQVAADGRAHFRRCDRGLLLRMDI